jgi:hypothetical protein
MEDITEVLAVEVEAVTEIVTVVDFTEVVAML